MFPDEIYISRYRLSKADCFPNVDGHHVLMRVWIEQKDEERNIYSLCLTVELGHQSSVFWWNLHHQHSLFSLFSDIYTETWARTYATIFLVPNLQIMDMGFLRYSVVVWANYNKSTYLYMYLLLGLSLYRTQTNIGALLSLKKKTTCGLPWWFSGKESAWQCRRHGFQSWSGKIPHAGEQLSSCTTTTEPVLREPGNGNY